MVDTAGSEREYLRITAAASLPRPLTQQVLSALATGWCASTADTRARTSSSSCSDTASIARAPRWTATLSVSNALTLDGFRPFQFTYQQVVGSAAAIVVTVRAAIAGSV